jgi:superfamily II DNA or RNA helicase
MVTQLNTTNKQYNTDDNMVNRFGRKKGDIKVRPGDRPGIIFVDCPANEYGKYPPIEFVTKEKSREQWEESKRREQERRNAMTQQERDQEDAYWKAKWEKIDAIDKKYNLYFTPEEIKNWRYETYGYEPDYYDRIYGTDEEIFGAYEELYGNKGEH